LRPIPRQKWTSIIRARILGQSTCHLEQRVATSLPILTALHTFGSQADMAATVLHRCPRWKSSAKAVERQRQRRLLLLLRPQPQQRPRLQLQLQRQRQQRQLLTRQQHLQLRRALPQHLRRRRPLSRHLQRPHYHQEFELRQHRALGRHPRLVHSACSRFAVRSARLRRLYRCA